MNKKLLSLLALFAVSSLAAPLAAVGEDGRPAHQGNPDRAKAWFQSHDTNNDGRICPDETDLPEAFYARADTDGDGCLSGQEAGMGARRAGGGQNDPWQMLQRLDANQDGMVCRDELPDGPPEGMGQGGRRGQGGRQGRPHDGQRGTGQDGRQDHTPGMAGGPDQDGRHRDPGMGGGQGGPPNLHEMLQRLDKNGDGCISRDEVPQGGAQGDMWQMFQRLDANQDGMVCRDELPDGPPMGMGQGGQQGRGQGRQQGRQHNGQRDTGQDGHPEHMPGMGGRPGGPDGQHRGPGMDGRPGALQNPHEWLRRLDKNGDGCISRDEVPQGGHQADPWQMFQRLDANQDGMVCRDELPDGPPMGMGQGGRRGQGGQGHRPDMDGGRQGTGPDGQHRGPGIDGRPGGRPDLHEMLAHLDKNGDGCISRDEVPPGGPGGQDQGNIWNRLRQLDANHDGKVCRDEITAPMNGAGRERLEQLFLQADADHDGCLTASETAHLRAPGQGDDMPRGDRAANFILRHDSNGDGQVTADEFPGPPELFARLDKDGDGILTAADFST